MLPSGDDALLIYGSIFIMLIVGGAFLGILLYVNKRLNAEQSEQIEMEKRAAAMRQNGHAKSDEK